MAIPPPPHYDIFISYAWKDGTPYVERLENDLHKAGYVTWRDKRNLDEYQDFSGEIEDAIRHSAYVVTCITPYVEANKNSFVRREINYAVAKNKPIIPLIFPHATPITLINHLTWIAFYERDELRYEQGLHTLLERLSDHPKTEIAYQISDPYREYIVRFYDYIVDTLQQTVFSLIPLRAKSSPDAVRRFQIPIHIQTARRRAHVQEAPTPSEAFDHFRSAYEAYDGRVLLLGAPGAGKTTTLLAFARDAANRRLENPNEALPLLGICATWDAATRPALAAWLCEGGDLNPLDIEQLIHSGKALLLLDGLDELGAGESDTNGADDQDDPRALFLDYIPTTCPVVLSSRLIEYQEIGALAKLKGGVILQPLNDEQMRDYLRDLPDLLHAITEFPDLREQLRTPLLLSMVTYAFSEASYELRQLVHLTEGDLRDVIFNKYIEARYAHEEARGLGMPFSFAETRHVLELIAFKNASGYKTEENVIRRADVELVLSPERAAAFIPFAVKMHYLLPRDEEGIFGFIHLLLRDTLAYTYAITHLHDPEWYQVHDPQPAAALGNMRDKRAVQPLIAALANPDENVRRGAAVALVKLHALAIEALISALIVPHEVIKNQVAEVLAKIGDERVVEALGPMDEKGAQLLVNALVDANPRVRTRALELLVRLGAGAVSSLIHALEDDNADLRMRGAEALGRIADRQAVPALIGALGDREVWVRKHAAEALERIGDARAVPSLAHALADEDWIVRMRAENALKKIATPEALAAVKAWRDGEGRPS